MIEWLIYALVGMVAGVSSGLLGLGGGLIVVPSLLSIFIFQGVPESIAMHMAVATSLMTIIVTSLASSYSHYRLKTINWHWFWRLVPGLIVGGLFGAYITTMVSGKLLQYVFALYACIAAVRIWFSMTLPVNKVWKSSILTIIVGGIIGIVSSLVGIGGGTLIVPYLMVLEQPMARAIGTSAVCCLPIAISAVSGFYLFNTEVLNTGAESSSHIQWNAFFGIIPSSIIFSAIAAQWAAKVPVKQLKRIFSLVLVITAFVLISKI